MSQRGFTLLELLVVLVIIAVVLTLIPGLMPRRQPGLDVDVAARAMADALLQARSDALLENREQVVALDVEARLFRSGGQRAPVQIDKDIELTFQTARSELLGDAIGQIRFFPDGSSTGGRIGLTLDGRHAEVVVDWLSGLVEIDHAER
ncbi:MAG: GspH/FimT family protein [Geminicoccaceae bacterium]